MKANFIKKLILKKTDEKEMPYTKTEFMSLLQILKDSQLAYSQHGNK